MERAEQFDSERIELFKHQRVRLDQEFSSRLQVSGPREEKSRIVLMAAQ